MPPINTGETQSNYDVIIVGSGAAGGQVAYTLCMEGVQVLMLEAGRNYDPVTETPMFNTPEQAPLRAARTPDRQVGYYDATLDAGWTIPGEPYTNASNRPKEDFRWFRARMLGGRTNHWARNCMRNGPYDFKARSIDGLGFDWPISYEDIAPYYDKAEALVGVCGSREGLENIPDSPADILHPPPKPRAAELLFHKHSARLGMKAIPLHRAVLTQRLNSSTLARRLHPGNSRAQKILKAQMDQRLACFWATDCGRGCSIKAAYQSPTVHLPPALATGNLDILTNAMARVVETNRFGQATGVVGIDKTTGREFRVKGRLVVLAASSMESVRLLLNSGSHQHPDGLANSSGLVGRYIMESVGASVRGRIPLLENLPPYNEDGMGGGHIYAPWWLYQEQYAGKLDFPRGYHILARETRRMPGVASFNRLTGLTRGAYGEPLKEAAQRYYGSFIGYYARGEMIPNENCYCEIDPEVKDQWGIPVLRFHWKWSDYEFRQVAHMHQTLKELFEDMGGVVTSSIDPTGKKGIDRGGETNHEIGGAIMGEDRNTSVTNQYSQCWDVKNLFIADGATFASSSDKNPTITIMALAWRAADRMLQEMRRGNL